MENSINLNICIGDRVFVLSNPNEDVTFDISFIGQEGIVKYFEYECGCGQSFPNDPMIGVEFSSGEIEEYWKEEICHL